MLITTKELTKIEEIVGYDSIAGIVLDALPGEGTKIRVIAKHPKDQTLFNVQQHIRYTPLHSTLDYQLDGFAYEAKVLCDKEFGVNNPSVFVY